MVVLEDKSIYKIRMILKLNLSYMRIGQDRYSKTKASALQRLFQSFVGAARFELATSWSQTRRDDRATLRPELFVHRAAKVRVHRQFKKRFIKALGVKR
jgi:hypothetical protein